MYILNVIKCQLNQGPRLWLFALSISGLSIFIGRARWGFRELPDQIAWDFRCRKIIDNAVPAQILASCWGYNKIGIARRLRLKSFTSQDPNSDYLCTTKRENEMKIKSTLLVATVCLVSIATSSIADNIKVGFNVPLTGFAAADGTSALNGAKLAVE